MRYFNTVFQSTIKFIMDMWIAKRNNEVNTLPELTRCPFCGEIHKWESATDMYWGKIWTVDCPLFGEGSVLVAYTEKDLYNYTKAWNSRPIETELKTAAILLGNAYNGK